MTTPPNPTQDPKPGYKTTEFALAAATLAVNAAVSLGYVRLEDQQYAYTIAATGVVALWTIANYLVGRVDLKTGRKTGPSESANLAAALDTIRDLATRLDKATESPPDESARKKNRA